MSRPASLIARLVGRFRRAVSLDREGSPVKRWRRFANRALSILGLAYLVLLASPGLLFAHQTTLGSFVIYSDEPIGPGMAKILEAASTKLDGSPLVDQGMRHRIFICNGRSLRSLLSPWQGSAFGSTYPWLMRRNTILNRVVVEENLIRSDYDHNCRRPLDSVIAHERIHALIGRYFGDLRAWSIPEWLSEGYCEYVGGNPSFNPVEGKRLIRANQDDGSGSFRYFRYGLMVRYLLDIEKVDVIEALRHPQPEVRVMEGVRAHLDEL